MDSVTFLPRPEGSTGTSVRIPGRTFQTEGPTSRKAVRACREVSVLGIGWEREKGGHRVREVG